MERIPIPIPHLFHRPFSLLHLPLKWRERLKKQGGEWWDQHYAIPLLGLLSTLFRFHCWGLAESELEFVWEKRQGNVIDPDLIPPLFFLLGCSLEKPAIVHRVSSALGCVEQEQMHTGGALQAPSAAAFQLRISWSCQPRETRTNNGLKSIFYIRVLPVKKKIKKKQMPKCQAANPNCRAVLLPVRRKNSSENQNKNE